MKFFCLILLTLTVFAFSANAKSTQITKKKITQTKKVQQTRNVASDLAVGFYHFRAEIVNGTRLIQAIEASGTPLLYNSATEDLNAEPVNDVQLGSDDDIQASLAEARRLCNQPMNIKVTAMPKDGDQGEVRELFTAAVANVCTGGTLSRKWETNWVSGYCKFGVTISRLPWCPGERTAVSTAVSGSEGCYCGTFDADSGEVFDGSFNVYLSWLESPRSSWGGAAGRDHEMISNNLYSLKALITDHPNWRGQVCLKAKIGENNSIADLIAIYPPASSCVGTVVTNTMRP